MRPVSPLRWLAVSVFIISTTLSFLDRQLLSALAPLILAEFHLTQTRFGELIAAFSIAYAASSIFSGWMLDRVGINRGISWAVAWWSASAAATSLVTGFGTLAACRAALGIGESASVPAVGKLNGIYLKPEERAMGAALNQVGISLGLALAPAWIVVALRYSWRIPFVLSAVIGLAWIPLWWMVSRRIPSTSQESSQASGVARHNPSLRLLKDRNLLLLVVVNILWMGTYSLWTSWTTLYLINVHGLTLRETARYVWIPPLVSNVGAFLGGYLSLRWMRRGADAVSARKWAIFVSAAGSLSTLALPFAHSARSATTVIAISFLFVLAGSVNIYAIPIDLYGPERSGLAIAALVFAYGILQTIISPIIGYLSDHHLYREVVWMVTVPPLLSCFVLMAIRPARTASAA